MLQRQLQAVRRHAPWPLHEVQRSQGHRVVHAPMRLTTCCSIICTGHAPHTRATAVPRLRATPRTTPRPVRRRPRHIAPHHTSKPGPLLPDAAWPRLQHARERERRPRQACAVHQRHGRAPVAVAVEHRAHDAAVDDACTCTRAGSAPAAPCRPAGLHAQAATRRSSSCRCEPMSASVGHARRGSGCAAAS